MSHQLISNLRAKKALAGLMAALLTVNPLLATAQVYQYQKRIPGLDVLEEPAPSPAAEVSTASLSFGQVGVGQSSARTVVLTNQGDADLLLSGAPTISGSGFYATTDCSATLAPEASCYVNVTFEPSAIQAYGGTLSIASNDAASPITVVLSGQGAALEAVGQLTAETSTDFGNPGLNTTTTRQFTFHNSGTAAAVGVYAQLSTFAGLNFSYNGCGTAAVPVTVAAGGSCSMTASWTPTAASSLAGASLTIQGNFTGAPATLALTGKAGEFDAVAGWSQDYDANTPPSAFPTTVLGATTIKTVYLRNLGTQGSIAAGFSLSGDISQFSLASVRLVKVYGNYLGSTTACEAVIAPDKLSSSTCTAYPKGGTFAGIEVRLAYIPTEIGNHTVTVTPTTNNGTALPAPLVLAGAGEFNPTAQWSTGQSTTTAFNSTTSSFGTLAVGTTTTKALYLRNVGTHGPLAGGVTLSGDTTQFKVSTIRKAHTSSASFSSCVSGGVIAAGGASASPCTADALPGAGIQPHVQVVIQYAPTEIGNHTITVTPTTNNGSVLPEPLVLTGAGEFNPTAQWSSAQSTATAFNSTTSSFGIRAVGTTLNKSLYLRNVGTHGPLAAGVTLSGDTAQFKVAVIRKAHTSSGTSTCVSGGVIAAGGASASPCMADALPGSGIQPHVEVIVQYAPTEIGNHTITVTPTTNNGSVLPEPLVLTGAGG